MRIIWALLPVKRFMADTTTGTLACFWRKNEKKVYYLHGIIFNDFRKSFCIEKEMINKVKRQHTEWEKIFSNHVSDRG